MHVSDCIRALKNLRGSDNFEVFNVGHSETLTVRNSIEIICDLLKVSPDIQFGKSPRGWIGDNPVIILDASKAGSFGWKPKVDIRTAVSDTVNWLVGNPWVLKNVR
jgi:UDP-glucose 4-epimerase